MFDTAAGKVALFMLSPILDPLGRYLDRRQSNQIESDINATTRDDIYNSLHRRLRHASVISCSDNDKLFPRFAAAPTPDFPNVLFWTEKSLRSYLLATFSPTCPPAPHSLAASLDAAVPILWRCLYFYAWYPFQGQNPYGRDDVVDRKAFERGIGILAGLDGFRTLKMDAECTLFHSQGLYPVLHARRTFRSLCLPYTLRLGEKAPRDVSHMPPKEPAIYSGLRVAHGTRLGDVVDALNAARERFSKLIASESVYEEAARKLLGPLREEDEAGFGVLPTDELEKLLNLLLSLRFRRPGAIEITSQKDRERADDDLHAAAVQSFLSALQRHRSPNDTHTAYITHDTWMNTLAFTQNIHLALRRLWTAIFRPDATLALQEVKPTCKVDLLPNSIVQAMALYSLPLAPLDDEGSWPGEASTNIGTEIRPWTDRSPYLRPRLCDLQHSLLTYATTDGQISSDALMGQLCGENFSRLVLIKGRTVGPSKDGSDQCEQPALFGVYLTSALWTDQEALQPQQYQVEYPTCVFQLFPSLRIMQVAEKNVPKIAMSSLMDRLPGTAGSTGDEGERLRETQIERLVNLAVQRDGIDAEVNPDTAQKLKASISEQDVIAVGSETGKVPALHLDFGSRLATFECSADRPNALLESPSNRPTPLQTRPQAGCDDGGDRLQPTRKGFRVEMQMERIEVYKVPTRLQGPSLGRHAGQVEGQRGDQVSAEWDLKSGSPIGTRIQGEDLKKRIQGYGPDGPST